MVPEPPSSGPGIGARLTLALVRFSLYFSPKPTALLIRRLFTETGAQTAAKLEAGAPGGIAVVADEKYDAHPDAVLDVYIPKSARGANRSLPLLVWVHGGAFVGGSKDELAGYMKRIAQAGYVVVAPNYSLAPEQTHPTPIRQVATALAYLEAESARYHIDPDRLIVAGDSAGAMIAAQIAATITNPDYARAVGVEPAVSSDRLRAVVLCCGPFDLNRLGASSLFGTFVKAVLWAYSGNRNHMSDEYFITTMSLIDFVTARFPPTFVTVGNADPLAPHSEALVDALNREGVDVETVFYPSDYEPPLGHEYQFDLDFDASKTVFNRLLDFIGERSAEKVGPA